MSEIYKKFDKYDRANLNQLLHIWQTSCSDMHDDCNRCPKGNEICLDISDKLIDKIYDKRYK